MKAHLIDTHLLVPRSRSSAKVKVKYQGHVSKKMGVSEALVFHKQILCMSAFLHTELTGQSVTVERFRPSKASSFVLFIRMERKGAYCCTFVCHSVFPSVCLSVQTSHGYLSMYRAEPFYKLYHF